LDFGNRTKKYNKELNDVSEEKGKGNGHRVLKGVLAAKVVPEEFDKVPKEDGCVVGDDESLQIMGRG
jgi:hypothetical protein